MVKFSFKILILLILLTFSMSILYSFEEFVKLLNKNKLEYKNLVLAISNIGLSIVFFRNIICFDNIQKKNLIKTIAFTIMLLLTIYIGFIFIDFINYGVRINKELTYQIISILFCGVLTIYSIKSFIENKIIN